MLERNGVRGLSLRALAREAGVSHSAPAHHFPNALALLAGLMAEGFDRLSDIVELTSDGYDLARSTLGLVMDAFDLEIGDLDEAERSELGLGLARLSLELGDRLRS